MADPANGMIVARTRVEEERSGRTVVIGLVVEGGTVTEVAPYGRRWEIVGLDAREAWRVLVGRGWRVYWLPDEGPAADHSGSTPR